MQHKIQESAAAMCKNRTAFKFLGNIETLVDFEYELIDFYMEISDFTLLAAIHVNEDAAKSGAVRDKMVQNPVQQGTLGIRKESHHQDVNPNDQSTFASGCNTLPDIADKMAEVHGNRTHLPCA